MKEYLTTLIPRLKEFSLSLDKKEIFIDKPWVWIDENNDQQKFIFKRNGDLIMSLNGQVSIGKWEYISAAKSLLIDRIQDKILLNQGFIDEAVMVLKKDGRKSENFMLVNEQIIPDLNVEKYLKDLYYAKNMVQLWRLENGDILEIHNGSSYTVIGSKATINIAEIGNSTLVSQKGTKIQIQDNKISKILKYANVTLLGGKKIIIEYEATTPFFIENLPVELGNKVFFEDGKTQLLSGKYKVNKFKSFKVEDGQITKVGMFL